MCFVRLVLHLFRSLNLSSYLFICQCRHWCVCSLQAFFGFVCLFGTFRAFPVPPACYRHASTALNTLHRTSLPAISTIPFVEVLATSFIFFFFLSALLVCLVTIVFPVDTGLFCLQKLTRPRPRSTRRCRCMIDSTMSSFY